MWRGPSLRVARGRLWPRRPLEKPASAAALRPDMKVLFMSVYTSEGIVHPGVLTRDPAFLQ